MSILEDFVCNLLIISVALSVLIACPLVSIWLATAYGIVAGLGFIIFALAALSTFFGWLAA